jgi:hypothetical protein
LEDHEVHATAAACIGCHDAEATQAHAELNTTAIGVEACAVCHGAGSGYAIDEAHARSGL